MSKKKTPTKIKTYRSAESGQFVTKEYAQSHPKTTISENIKKGGGTSDTGARKKNK